MITDGETLRLTRLIQVELLRDKQCLQAFLSELASHDNPIPRFLTDAMAHQALEQADVQFAAGQLLGMVKTFLFWPELLIGERHPSNGILEECTATFLARYGNCP